MIKKNKDLRKVTYIPSEIANVAEMEDSGGGQSMSSDKSLTKQFNTIIKTLTTEYCWGFYFFLIFI